MQNERFTVDDFKDAGTETIKVMVVENMTQTAVEDLCGECVGVKKRRNHLQSKLPILNPSNSMTSTVFSRSNSFVIPSEKPTNLIEGKKKHERIKLILNTCKNVLIN